MNMETLNKAQDMLKQIKELEKHIEILENGYINSIMGFDYSYAKEEGERVHSPLDGELREIIMINKRNQLKRAKEFEILIIKLHYFIFENFIYKN